MQYQNVSSYIRRETKRLEMSEMILFDSEQNHELLIRLLAMYCIYNKSDQQNLSDILYLNTCTLVHSILYIL